MLDYCTIIYTPLTVLYYNGGKNQMTNIQRMKSDIATMDRRDQTDRTVRDNRNRNDELTGERRSEADKTLRDSRIRNDEMTANRRKINDQNPWGTLAISLLILAALAIGAYLIFI